MALELHVIITSTRPGRAGPIFGKWLEGVAKAHGKFDTKLIDLADFNLPIFDEPKHPRLGDYQHAHTKKWSASVKAADAFVFVTPEYNYGPSPALINALTYLAAEWNYKPAGFLSYGGISGGTRAVQQAKPTLTTLKMMPIPEGIAIPNFAGLLNEDREFASNDLINASAQTMLDELHKWAGALKTLR
ncbi:NADPH-dependent FMN reductase [Phreatobacter sp. AB_2022a]|uniref:NADPH-dependent FMN reductase n=1 Tax=Phreatobacter sp. AB_2022a TaxID=3003134 RepID=UPI0022874756|nr:NAD(P)H-dependent oxidoreductase [Phreatobacter sp. AB_2022a]MCZ0735361.1 NAD(P)H-dependent oxidoreductase [Phreatobacter sp. AB_2022a]